MTIAKNVKDPKVKKEKAPTQNSEFSRTHFFIYCSIARVSVNVADC